jgi:hypothetical protein
VHKVPIVHDDHKEGQVSIFMNLHFGQKCFNLIFFLEFLTDFYANMTKIILKVVDQNRLKFNGTKKLIFLLNSTFDLVYP